MFLAKRYPECILCLKKFDRNKNCFLHFMQCCYSVSLCLFLVTTIFRLLVWRHPSTKYLPGLPSQCRFSHPKWQDNIVSWRIGRSLQQTLWANWLPKLNSLILKSNCADWFEKAPAFHVLNISHHNCVIINKMLPMFSIPEMKTVEKGRETPPKMIILYLLVTRY